MQKSAEALEAALLKGSITQEQFNAIVKKHSVVQETSDTLYLLLQAAGFPIVFDEATKRYELSTQTMPIKSSRFCIVDLETNGGKPDSSQIIEIGAVLMQDEQIIDTFESLVHCSYLPKSITKITGIDIEALKHAPGLKKVLLEFKQFLGDSVFVAHNVNFDYKFLSKSFKRFGLGEIANRKLCTIELAKKTIPCHKYGLSHLNEVLHLQNDARHRALGDAKATAKLLLMALQRLPRHIQTVEELIYFAKHGKKVYTT